MTAAPITGPARVDRSPLALARRLRPGDIAVIDAPDLDRGTATVLAARRPGAVVNASASLAGRLPTTGALVLLEAGIAVIDQAGPAVMTVRDGARASVEGGALAVDGREVATGAALDVEEVRGRVQAAGEDLHVHVASFTATALDLLGSDAGVLLDGDGLPPLRVPVDGRAVVVVTPRFAGASPALTRFARERRPVVIGVGEGANAARAAGLVPRIVVGNIDAVDEELLRRAVQVVVHDPDGREAGAARAQAMGLAHDSCEAVLASEDVALLAAHAAGAEVVVIAGGRGEVLDYVEDRSTAGAGALLARLVAGGIVVDAAALPAVYRPRYSAWTAWGALGLAALALALAVWGTPEGRDALTAAWEWLSVTLGGSR